MQNSSSVIQIATFSSCVLSRPCQMYLQIGDRPISIAGMYIQREIYQSPACIYKCRQRCCTYSKYSSRLRPFGTYVYSTRNESPPGEQHEIKIDNTCRAIDRSD